MAPPTRKGFWRIIQDLTKGRDFLVHEMSSGTVSHNGRNTCHLRVWVQPNPKPSASPRLVTKLTRGGVAMRRTKGIRQKTFPYLAATQRVSTPARSFQHLTHAPRKVRRGIRLASFALDAFGTSQVTHQNGAAALIEYLLNGRQGGTNAQIVGNGARFTGDVKVDSHQDFFAHNKPNVIDGMLCCKALPWLKEEQD